jgi:imidazolonepropionase-like amidohydrolase
VALGPELREAGDVRDAAGLTITPWLIELHIHLYRAGPSAG